MIPTQKRKPDTALSRLVVTVYGKPKIGKSTFASQFPGALFAATEPGLQCLEVFETPIHSWGGFLSLCGHLEKDPKWVETLVIDVVDLLYYMCQEHVCQQEGVKHPSDLSYGKGFSMLNTEFRRVLAKTATLQTKAGKRMGLVMTSHAKEIEVDTRSGKHLQWSPSIGGSGRTIIEGMSDLLLFADMEGDTRVLRTTPHRNWIAGDRTGLLPPSVLLDYQELKKALEGKVK